MSFIYLVILSYLSWTVEGAIGQSVRCRTTRGEPGECIRIKQCQPIWLYFKKYFKLNIPSLKQKKDFRRNLCTHLSNSEPLVCCANKYLDLNERMDLGITNEKPPEVSNHENLKLLPFECGRVPIDDRIRHGEAANLGEFPWMALLFFQKEASEEKPTHRCSGTVINERYILTAAHCICDSKFKLLYVRVGEHDLSSVEDCEITKIGTRRCASPVQNLPVEEIIIHPNHTARHDDIALLRISRMNFTSVENVKPICLPMIDQGTEQQITKDFIVTGWGLPFKNAVTAKSILQRVEIPIVDLETCKEIYRKSAMITSRQICAGGSKSMKSSCLGDSGGPLQTLKFINDDVRYVQEGIVSFSHRICGKVGYPTVNTNIVFYLNWVLDSIRP